MVESLTVSEDGSSVFRSEKTTFTFEENSDGTKTLDNSQPNGNGLLLEYSEGPDGTPLVTPDANVNPRAGNVDLGDQLVDRMRSGPTQGYIIIDGVKYEFSSGSTGPGHPTMQPGGSMTDPTPDANSSNTHVEGHVANTLTKLAEANGGVVPQPDGPLVINHNGGVCSNICGNQVPGLMPPGVTVEVISPGPGTSPIQMTQTISSRGVTTRQPKLDASGNTIPFDSTVP